MKSYADKLVELLRKEMATPQEGRGGYNNPTINATGDGSRSLNVVDYKNGILENGVSILIPPFINSGDKIIVRTSDKTYVEKAKK